MLLIATFLAASVTSRLGLRRKTLLGIAEDRGGRRGAGNAIANTGLAALAALLARHDARDRRCADRVRRALTAGGSDTVASEVGKAFGRRTYMVHTLAAVPPGTPGAISLEGTAAGLVGACALGGPRSRARTRRRDRRLPRSSPARPSAHSRRARSARHSSIAES